MKRVLPLEDVLAVVGNIYDASLDSTLWQSALQGITSLLECDAGGLTAFDKQAPVMSVAVAAGGYNSQAAIEAYTTYYAPRDVLLKFALTQPEGFIYHDDAFPDQDKLRGSEIYNEFFPTCGANMGMASFVFRDETRHSLLSLRRSTSEAKIGDSEMRVLSLLMPHIKRAFQVHRQLSGLQSVVAAQDEPLDRLAVGVVLLNGKGCVEKVNAAARRILAKVDGLAVFRDRLLCPGVEGDRLCRLIAQALAPVPEIAEGGGLLSVSRPSGRPAFQLLIAPARQSKKLLEAAAMVLIKDPEDQAVAPQRALQDLFGLTVRESELASLLSTGLSVADVAERMGIGRETARTHLASVFAKTDTNRQSELVRKLATSLAGLVRETSR